MKRKMSENSLNNLEENKGKRFLNTDLARKAGVKGALVKEQKKKEKQTIREVCEAFLESPVPDKLKEKIKEIYPLALSEGLVSFKICFVVALAEKILAGDVKALELFLSIIGENPQKDIKINADIKQNTTINDMSSLSDAQLIAMAQAANMEIEEEGGGSETPDEE